MTAAPLACLLWPQAPAAALRLLRRYSPHVAAAAAAADLFYLDASGLVGLYASQQRWAEAVLAAVRAICPPTPGGKSPAVALALGFHPEALALLVRTLPACTHRCSPSAEAEQRWLGRLPLQALGVQAAGLQRAQSLGLQRLQDVLPLATAELHARLGASLATGVARLQAAAKKVTYAAAPLPCVQHWQAEEPSRDACQLLFAGKALIDALVLQAAAERKQVAALTWVLHFAAPRLRASKPARLQRRLVAARPSNEVALWTQLLRLWLDGLQLPWAVEKLTVAATLTAPAWVQAPLWPLACRRDVLQAHAGLAKVRATFGEAAVVQARLLPSHLPEHRFAWKSVPLDAPLLLRSSGERVRALRCDPLGLGRWPRLRRIFATPQPVPVQWLRRLHKLPRASALACANAAGTAAGAANNVHVALPAFRTGPISYSHGWWEQPQDRDYCYVSLGTHVAAGAGSLLWLYYARQSQRWWWHGVVD